MNFFFLVGKIKTKVKGGNPMDNTHEFVEKLHDKQEKDERNKKRQGKGNPNEKLPSKQH